jgi:formylglycine-generating enzyme
MINRLNIRNNTKIRPIRGISKISRIGELSTKILSINFLVLLISCNNDKKITRKSYELTPTITILGKEKPQNAPIIGENTEGVVAPENMLLVQGGYTYVGNDSSGLFVENPRIWVHIKPFYMDITPITVAQFRAFIKATHYKTEAEKFGNGGFIDTSSDNKWILKEGANWAYPQGKDYPKALDNHPVTQVSWNDALAYTTWVGKRLPHEWEWEHAARNARNDQTLYSFGNNLKDENGNWRTNIWQGTFPFKNRVEDGYKFTSPVGIFGKTPLGLTDMTGNIWQWCDNGRFEYPQVLEALEKGEKIIINESEKAQKSGSFLCEDTWCHGYRVSGRSFTSPETSLMHVGFRCVKDIQ